jgi:hypothetical protein
MSIRRLTPKQQREAYCGKTRRFPQLHISTPVEAEYARYLRLEQDFFEIGDSSGVQAAEIPSTFS